MDKKEVAQLLNYVNVSFPSFLRDTKPETVLDFWFKSLKDFEYEQVLNNLIDYVQNNEYPPKIKDLVNGLIVNEKSNVPGIEETKKILDSYQVPIEKRVSSDKLREMFKKHFGNEWGKGYD